MPNTREKLIELLMDAETESIPNKDGFYVCYLDRVKAEQYADHLIANGVTVHEWHPRTEPPKKNGRYLCRYVFNDRYDMPFEQVLSFYTADENPHFRNEGEELGMKVTHWMPLPEPPKEV